MFKVIGIMLLLLGAAFGIPQTREKIAPIMGRMLAPVGGKLGAPAKKWSAKNEANVLARKLAEDNTQGKKIPTPKTFQAWVKSNTKAGKRGLDPWDNPYYMQKTAKEITVGSSGPDGTRNTPDDIRATVASN